MIRRVSGGFVPVAVNLYRVRRAQDPGGELFRSVQRQKDQYQGIWLVSPEGRVLAGHHDVRDQKQWAQEVLRTLDAGLEAFGPVPPRAVAATDPLPQRGRGVRADGSATLAIYTRYLHDGRRDGRAVLDSLTLPARDWSAFAPPRPAAGAEWTLPSAVARQLCRVLSPSSDQSTMPRPEEVTAVRVTGRVEAIRDGMARLRFEGSIAAEHRYENRVSRAEARLEGEGRAALDGGGLQSLLLVFAGTHRSPPPYDSPRQTGGVVEWRRSP